MSDLDITVLKTKRTSCRKSSTEIFKGAKEKLDEIENVDPIEENVDTLQVLISELDAFVKVFDSYISRIESINSDIYRACSDLNETEKDKIVTESENSLFETIQNRENLKSKVGYWSHRVASIGHTRFSSHLGATNTQPTIAAPSSDSKKTRFPRFTPTAYGQLPLTGNAATSNPFTTGNVKFSHPLDYPDDGNNDRMKSPSLKNVKLDKIKLPTFDGTLSEYKHFIDSFFIGVHEQPLPDIHKLQYLMSYLRGPAKDAVSGIQIRSENYEVALRILNDRFGNEQLIINEVMEKLNNLVCKSSSLNHLQEFYDQIMMNVRSLEAIGIVPHSYEFMLIPSLMKRIPQSIKIHIIRNLGKHRFDLNDLMKCFDNELYFLRQTCSTSSDSTDDFQVSSTMLTQTQQQQPSNQQHNNRYQGNPQENEQNSKPGKRSRFRTKLECVFCCLLYTSPSPRD